MTNTKSDIIRSFILDLVKSITVDVFVSSSMTQEGIRVVKVPGEPVRLVRTKENKFKVNVNNVKENKGTGPGTRKRRNSTQST